MTKHTNNGSSVKSLEPSQAQLKGLLHYSPETGIFTRLAVSGGCLVGSVAGTADSRGYQQIRICGRKYLAHRLAWLYVYGVFPSKHLDHVNRDKSDNRISNLREATRSENNQNRGLQKNNTSCYRGVCWNSRFLRWQARISVSGKRKSLGYFETAELAYEAYKAAAIRLHTCNPLSAE